MLLQESGDKVNDKNNDVIRFAKILNSKGIMDPEWLRRNAIYYKLITYINHTIALFIAMNYEGTAVFVRRAAKELDFLSERGYCEEYFDIAEEYLYIITRYLIEKRLITEVMTESIPAKFRDIDCK